MRRVAILLVSVLSMCLAVGARAQTPLATAFTYQGELASGGTAVTGAYDVRFRLYDAANGGNQIGSTLCSDNLAITAGRFTVSLDFGAAFAGQKRYLEIEVRPDTGLDCSNGTGYTTLAPRQELTAAPNATYAQNAGTATTAANAMSLNGQSAGFYQNAANLTGTIADARLSGNVARLDGNQTFTGQTSFSNPANTFSGVFTGSGSGLTNLNGGSINTGTLARSSLSADVQSGVGTLVPDLSLAGGVATGSFPFSVAASGSVACVVNQGSNTLQVFSVSSTAGPTLAGSVATGSGPSCVAMSGSFAYVVNNGPNRLQVFDISNPAAPTLAGSVATGNFPYSVAVSGSFAYVANLNANTLQVFDISNPAAITLAASVAAGNAPSCVAVSGSFAFVVADDSTLRVFNISSPAAPTLSGSIATGCGPISVAVSGSFACVANYCSDTLQVFKTFGVGFGTPLAASSLAGVNGSGLTGINAASLNGQPASFYTNASNITSGVLANVQTTGTNLGTPGTLVLRDASGNFTASTITAALNGNAATATVSATATNATQLNGQSASFYTNASNITSGTLANARTTGTNLGTPGTLVLRDASGNFSASTITAALNGNAATATVAATATNASQLNGQSASFYTNASNLTSGTVGEAQLSSNIPRLNANTNIFTGFDQVFDGMIRVRGGIITDDFQGGWNTTDLGLYSARPGYFMRFVTSGGGFVWYSDGVAFPGGNSARMQLTSGGNLSVVGSLSKGGGSFKIDHPLDPENKYLYHSFVESPDMMNVYNGNVTTDADGYATITLPDYFEALNRDFRYQLTVVDEGTFAMVRVSRRIAGNSFEIASSVPGVEVSWQITGIRKDAWAEKNRIPNSVDKVGPEKGKYLHPEAFDKPVSQSILFSPAAASQSASK